MRGPAAAWARQPLPRLPVDLLEAAREFAEIHARGEVDCFGLHPLLT
ncbi:MAG: hypothetical protein ACRDF0_06940 [Candidatus Limnocylindria bacterium]